MKIIDRYVIRQLLPPILLGLLVFTFVLIIPQIKDHAESFIAKGVSPLVVLHADPAAGPAGAGAHDSDVVPARPADRLQPSVGRSRVRGDAGVRHEPGAPAAAGGADLGAVCRRHLLRLGDRRARQQPALPRDRVQRRGAAGRVQGALARLLRRLPEPDALRARRARRRAAAGTACSSPTPATRRRRPSTWRGTVGWRSTSGGGRSNWCWKTARGTPPTPAAPTRCCSSKSIVVSLDPADRVSHGARARPERDDHRRAARRGGREGEAGASRRTTS